MLDYQDVSSQCWCDFMIYVGLDQLELLVPKSLGWICILLAGAHRCGEPSANGLIWLSFRMQKRWELYLWEVKFGYLYLSLSLHRHPKGSAKAEIWICSHRKVQVYPDNYSFTMTIKKRSRDREVSSSDCHRLPPSCKGPSNHSDLPPRSQVAIIDHHVFIAKLEETQILQFFLGIADAMVIKQPKSWEFFSQPHNF